MTGWRDRLRRAAARRSAARWFAKNRRPDAARHLIAFETWRRRPAHAEAYARLEQHFAAAGAVARRAAPGGRAAGRRGRLVAPALAGAAALALGIAVPPMLQDRTLATGVGEPQPMRLADGSRVTLDTATKLEPRFDAAARRVRLRVGRARFDVAHGDPRPFTVEAGGLVVTATGTRFDVRLEDGRAEVTLLSGRVEVAAGRARQRLAPGGALALKPGQPLVATAANLAAAHAWPAGHLVFTDRELAEVVAEANRYTHRPIELSDPALASLRVSGRFAATASEALARALAASFDLALDTRGDRLRLGPKKRLRAGTAAASTLEGAARRP